MSEPRRNFLARLATGAGAVIGGCAAAATGATLTAQRDDTHQAVNILDCMSSRVCKDALSGKPMLDHTREFQAALDSAVSALIVPENCVFNLTRPLSVNKKIRLSGGGELRFTAGIANAAAITVHGSGCDFDGVFLTNPNLLQARTGNRNVGILFRANSGSVTRSTIFQFQNGIQVESDGEYHDFIIANNKILDCIGAGGGPADTQSGYGEDRGDGITIWGCCATVTGNLVTAKAGQDCRVGIHVEALAEYHAYSFPLQDNLCTIVGNVVRGAFRRGVVTENVNNTAITGNTCEGSTWWGIAVVRSRSCTVMGNAVIVSRPASDRSGSSYAPIRAGIQVYGGAIQCIISGNTVDVTQGSADAAISLQGLNSDSVAVLPKQGATADGTPNITLAKANPAIQIGQRISGAGVPPLTYVLSVAGATVVASQSIKAGSLDVTFTWHERGQGITVTDNSVSCLAAGHVIGIWAQSQDNPTISNNSLRAMGDFGISCYDVADPIVNGNTIIGQNSPRNGIDLRSNTSAAVLIGNIVEGFNGPDACGIAAEGRVGGVISGNFLRDCKTDIDLYQCKSMSVTGNSSARCWRHYAVESSEHMIVKNNANC
ncbi:right-handed parallel beta-helix repeat-containing protein [Paraburkholderia fungorum]|uniref:NosD domain-containing protein n=1 Tax=Paraburkholderia fungorum TaxID=134537 RepID=UPI0038BD7254